MIKPDSSSEAVATRTFLVYKFMKGYTRGAGKETDIHTERQINRPGMNTTHNHQPSNRLINAYNQMMASIRTVFEEADTSDSSLRKALDIARDRAAELGEITLDEAQEIAEYIKRDINDAAEYMMETSAEFGDWLMLDIEVIERKVVDMFLSVADRTRIELEQFKNYDHQPSVYYSGEITGPGTLICNQCGNKIAFTSTAQIENCPECNNNAFQRAEFKRSQE